MLPHHKAWLEAHPERSSEWLKRMLSEGFQVHHIDGDHSNDHPANLALIEAVDHMRLHGMFGLARPDIHKVGSRGGKKRWAGKTKKDKSAHMTMMINARWKRERKAKKAKRAAAAHRLRNQQPLQIGGGAGG